MKKNLKLFLILFIMASFTVGCAQRSVVSDEKPQPGTGEYANAPEWVLDPSMEGGLSALGIANIGPAGMQFARNEAMANGRAELARMISLKVKDLNKNFAQQTGIGDNATVEKVTSQVSKQVTEQTLNGSRAKKAWISPKDNLHILMVLDSQIVKDAVKDSVTTSYKNDQALWQQFQAQKGHEELDKEIAKEFGNK